jgi:hypothetical protein
MRSFLILLLAALAEPTAAQDLALPNRVPEHELSIMRGGFQLPGGLDVAMAVATETRIDGSPILRSVFTAAGGATSLQVFGSSSGDNQAGSATSGTRTADNVTAVTFDGRSGTITVPARVNMPTVSHGASAAAAAAGAALDLTDGAVQTASGRVSVQTLPVGSRVNLQGDGIDVSHLFGSSYGSAIANNASDRAIDTSTTVGLDIRGASPLNLGSSMFRVDAVALDAVRSLTR